ncbi:MAG: FAD binding domain-containing protein [Clostridia bacterium]|nr:FAD binding domain-containing protein [Clostridia bacterium]
MITIQNYVRARSVEEAWQLNQNKRNRIFGGMLWLRLGRGSVNTAIDLCDLGLDTIEENEEQFSIGAYVTLRDIELHRGLNTYTCGAASNAVKDIVGVQFRNMATVGGSIWGRFGFSDVLTLFLSLDSYVELYKGGIIPLCQFVSMKPDRDVLLRLIVKKTPGKAVYTSMRNQRTDFPVIALALSKINGEYRASVGARPNRAFLVRSDNAEGFAQLVANTVPTGTNLRGSAAYRTHLIRALCDRALAELEVM